MSAEETPDKTVEQDSQSTQDKDTHSKRMRFRKTETSRLKSVADESDAESRGESPAVSLPTSAKAAVPSSPGRTAVVDPMALRDTNTSKVKRVQAAKDSSPLSTVTLPGAGAPLKKTETVQLKVVQQKKKELDQEMNPASTVRLKSPGGAGPSIAIPNPRPAAAPRDTMKISLPKLERKAAGESGDDGAATSAKPASGAPAPTAIPRAKATATASAEQTAKVAPSPAVKTSTTVLEKIKPSKSGSDTSTADTAPQAADGPADAEGGGGKTLKLRGTPRWAAREPAARGSGAGKTLKISGGATSAKTLKVNSDDGDKTVAAAETPGDDAKTIKVDEGGKGLKLRSRQQPLGEAPVVAQSAAKAATGNEAPGVLYTLGAAATLVAIGVTTYFLASQAATYIF